MVARANSFYLVDNLPYQISLILNSYPTFIFFNNRQVWDMEIKTTGTQDVTELSAYITPAFGSRVDAQNRWNIVTEQEDSGIYPFVFLFLFLFFIFYFLFFIF
jgi:hypothetical protein